jgi:nucleoside-diphosphate-sugar epimerase
MLKHILITGGAGYVGSRLSFDLLERGYKVKIYDTLFFGDEHLSKHRNLKVVKGDIRDIKKFKEEIVDVDTVIHLACIANDASFALDEKLSKTINLEAFEPIVIAAKKKGVKRFIYASTSSVYGLSDKKDVTEDHPLVPLTSYNKFKGMCEPLLLKHTNENFTGVVFRPATVCGYSKRQRLDLSVNILTNFAVNKNHIVVFGGKQMRPNLHILDYIRVVNLFINAPKEKINNQIFNVGYQNKTIEELALIVKKVVEKKFLKKNIEIKYQSSDDNRSYHINSDKIKKTLNFIPIYNIENAIEELCEAFNNNLLPNSFEDDKYFNVKRMLSYKIV